MIITTRIFLIASASFSAVLVSAQHSIEFDGFVDSSTSIGKVATLYSGTLPPGEWIIVDLIQNGVTQEIGGVNSDASIVDNAIVIEGNSQRYGLNHRYDGMGIYDGVPYTNQPLSGTIEISLWEADNGGLSAAAPGTVFLQSANPNLDAYVVGTAMVLMWSAADQNYRLQCTGSLIHGQWSAVTNEPVIIGDQCISTNQCSDDLRFYRLYWSSP
jgi:hypothetical protein